MSEANLSASAPNSGNWTPAVSSGNLTFISPKQLAEAGKEGVILEGKFIEALPTRFDDGKSDYKFETLTGDTVIINNSGSLAYQMKTVEPGTLCQVIYNGKQVLERGPMKGKEAHIFEVNVDLGA